jgi:trehalose/maltose hydrolase-like predicted phosphorylase
MGPDEDHHDVDNNGYTNVNAAINLYFGDFAGCTCKDVLNLSEEDYANFTKIARSLTLLYDEENDRYPQYEGYNGEEIKQADVVLIGYPLQLKMKDSTKKNNLNYYDERTRETGPAMTWAMHTIGYLDLKEEAEAAKFFQRSYDVYTHEPFKTWSENQPTDDLGVGNFITGAGGFLQSVINGYGGVRLHFDSLTITNFFLPPGTNSLEFNGITYLHNVFTLKIMGELASIEFLTISNAHPIKIEVQPSGDVYYPSLQAPITFNHTEVLSMKATNNVFGKCQLKETELGIIAGAGGLKISFALVALAYLMNKLF